MSEYYLISQLPSLDGISDNMPIPITEERFLELCDRFLGKKAQREMKNLKAIPSRDAEKTGSALIDAWNDGERDLRLALCKIRAGKMKKTFETENRSLPIELVKVAGAAAEMESPMEAERFLFTHRMAFLESLRPMDTFSEDFVYYYGLKLKLILRMRQFDTKLGETAYRNIYNSILNGDKVEAI